MPLYPNEAVTIGVTTFFTGVHPEYGLELWKTDGTAAGTRLIKDVLPGPGDSYCSQLTVSGGYVYFVADDGEHGYELWRTNGTTEGTHLVADMNWGSTSSTPWALRSFQGGVSFVADVSQEGISLCHTTGTSNGTRVIKVLPPTDQMDVSTMPMAEMGGNLYFAYPDPAKGWELWKSNGTAAGTAVLKDIYPGVEGSYVSSFMSTGATLYFTAQDAAHGFELWKTNGTAGGTVMVKDIYPGIESSVPQTGISVGNQVFFAALDSSGDFHLWRSDGTPNGTWQASANLPEMMVAFKNKLYFVPRASDASLVRIDGPGQETWIYSFYGTQSFQSTLVAGTDRLFLALPSTTEGMEVWSSDGTTEGTFSPKPLAGSQSGYWGGLIAAGKKAYFAGFDPVEGSRLWKSDGTTQGTTAFGPTFEGNAGSAASSFRSSTGVVYFNANNGIDGTALWRTNGTAAGTTLVKKIRPGVGAYANFLGELNNTVFFSADDGTSGTELWKTDGTEEGTVRVANIAAGLASSDPRPGLQLGAYFYFSAVGTSAQGRELWRTDGTEAGTTLFAELFSLWGSDPAKFTLMGGALYFVTDNASGILRRTDGTSVTSISGVSYPSNLIAFNGMLYFSVNSGGALQLWRSQGTTATTTLVKSVISSAGGAKLDNFVVFGDRLLFRATSSTDSRLWETDGTDAGTLLSSITDMAPQSLSATSAELYFTTNDAVSGLFKLWHTDGETPPVLLQQGVPGVGKAALGSHIFGKALGNGNYQLWKTNGAPENTEPISNAVVDNDTRVVDFDVVADRWLVFPGYEIDSGVEPHVIDLGGDLAVERIAATGMKTGVFLPGSGLDFGKAGLGASVQKTLRLRNSGSTALTGVSAAVEGENAGSFVIDAVPPSSLAGGQWFDVQITFTPQGIGAHAASLNIGSQDPNAGSLVIGLGGIGIDPLKPEVLADPQPRLVLAGQPVSLTAMFAAAEPVTYRWRQGTTVVGTDEVLLIPAAQTVDSGLYTLETKNQYGFTTSGPAVVAVIKAAPSVMSVLDGAAVTLRCEVSAPAEALLSYRWFRNGVPVSDGGRFKGSGTARLTIAGFKDSDAGDFDCRVTLHNGAAPVTMSHGLTELSRMLSPSFSGLALETAYVGQPINIAITADNRPAYFAASGLPPGILFDRTTGVLSGRPTAAKMAAGAPAPYQIKFTAGNAAGRTAPEPVYWMILPLELAGNYYGLIGRSGELNGELGGTIQLSVLATGKFTGFVTLGAFRHAIAGNVETSEDGDEATIVTNVGVLGSPPLALNLRLTNSTADISGTIMSGASGPVQVSGTLGHLNRSMPAAWAGYHTAAISPEPAVEGNSDYPQGDGFLTFTVSKAGMANWSGKLAEGTAITGSSPVGLTGRLGFHSMLYSRTGSLQGWSQLASDVNGSLDWFKSPQGPKSTARSYKGGFPLHSLAVNGGKYQKPFPGQAILGLADAPPDNAELIFADGGLSTNLSQTFAITSANVVKMPVNARQVKLTSLNAATGVFTGSFTVSDPDPRDATPPFSELKRSAKFNGVVVSQLGVGAGHFQLAELPALPSANVNNTPMHSGQVTLLPVTP